MGSSHFQAYIRNINRVNCIEMIEACNLEYRNKTFRASLVVNPITGLPYDEPQDDDV